MKREYMQCTCTAHTHEVRDGHTKYNECNMYVHAKFIQTKYKNVLWNPVQWNPEDC